MAAPTFHGRLIDGNCINLRSDDHFWMFEAGRNDDGDWFFMLRLGEYGVRSTQHGLERYHETYPEHVEEWRLESREVEA